MIIMSVVGVTNVGKSTLLDLFDGEERIKKIEVGKEFRKRYPPAYFEGKAAMRKTEEEAWQIFNEEYEKAEQANARIVLVDGQPRLAEQVDIMFNRFPTMEVLWLFAPHHILEKRLKKRDREEGKRELSRQRLINDYRQLHQVVACLMRNNVSISPVDTTEQGWDQRIRYNLIRRARK